MHQLRALIEPRVMIITGKGGVGKSSVTAALATLAAASGKRILIVELAGQCAMASLLGGPSAGYKVIQRETNLFTLSVTPEESMEEYLTRELHSRRLYKLIFKNAYVGPFIAAVPGLEDLMSIGKVMDLEREVDRHGRPRWDRIFVDAPATGQGLNLLRVPKAMMDMTRMGPFYQNTRLIHDLLVDPRRTALSLVTLPEEMPVNETLEMYRQIKQALDIRVSFLFINNLRPRLFSREEHYVLEAIASRGPDATATHPHAAAAVLQTGLEISRRATMERVYVDKLRDKIPLPFFLLPSLSRRAVGPQQVAELADHIRQGGMDGGEVGA